MDLEFLKDWPYPVAVAALFVVVLLRAGGTYAIGRAAQAGARRTRLSRAMSLPRFARIQTLVNLAAGALRMPFRRYLPALIVGSIIWAFLYATVGFVTFAAWRRMYELSPPAAVLSLVALLAGLAGYIIWQVRHRHDDQEREPANFRA